MIFAKSAKGDSVMGYRVTQQLFFFSKYCQEKV